MGDWKALRSRQQRRKALSPLAPFQLAFISKIQFLLCKHFGTEITFSFSLAVGINIFDLQLTEAAT